jgi:hypothetical protein
MVKGAYLVIRIREKDATLIIMSEDRFELNGRTTSSAFLPIAIHPKIVAKSNGPGG